MAPFVLPHTPPLSLQMAWKMHQCLGRLRFKAPLDLLFLLRHPSFDAAARAQALHSLAEECQADSTNFNRVRHLIAGHLHPLANAKATRNVGSLSDRANMVSPPRHA